MIDWCVYLFTSRGVVDAWDTNLADMEAEEKASESETMTATTAVAAEESNKPKPEQLEEKAASNKEVEVTSNGHQMSPDKTTEPNPQENTEDRKSPDSGQQSMEPAGLEPLTQFCLYPFC